jgi:hypothetical protein
MAPSSPKSSSYQEKVAAAKAVGLDANANWVEIKEAQKQAELARITAENLKKQRERGEALRLQDEKTRNENSLKQQQQQQQKKSAVTIDQQERERMVRTFQTRRRGRASLRINLGSSGSPYEGSSGISINL